MTASRHPPSTRPSLPVVPASFALSLLKETAAVGENPAALVDGLHLPLSLDDMVKGRILTLSDRQFIQIARVCITVLSAHANRECNMPPMSKDEVDMLCYCVINCETLNEVIHRAARFCDMLNGRAAKLYLTIEGDDAVFHMDTLRLPQSASALVADLTGLSFYHRLFSWLIGEPISISAYELIYESRGSKETLSCLFQHPIRYGQSGNQFRFSAKFLTNPVVRSYQRLVELLRVFPFDLIRTPLGKGDLGEAVQHLMSNLLVREEAFPTLTQLASFFNMSSATFRRRLAKEHVSLGKIKDRCRRELAIELLARETELKIADVSARLGFSDSRAFRRAFRQWTGQSPDAFRANTAFRKSGAADSIASTERDRPF